MSWKTRGNYVWRTRKPHSMLGLSLRTLLLAGLAGGVVMWMMGGPWWLAFLAPLFSGRHTAYVGQTGSRYHRDRQHLHGDSRYGATGKPWADLEPKVYPLPCLFPRWAWSRKLNEKLMILLLLPVYNIQDQVKWNPRKVGKDLAQRQRWARDEAKRTFEGKAKLVAVRGLRLALLLTIWAMIGYGVLTR